jgi:hypothetical protein
VFCAMTFLWLACYAVALAQMGDLFRRSPVRRALDAVTGRWSQSATAPADAPTQ